MRIFYYKVHNYSVNHPDNVVLGYVTHDGDFTEDLKDSRGVLGQIIVRRELLQTDETLQTNEQRNFIAIIARSQFMLMSEKEANGIDTSSST
jgi:hypothetical protein